MDSTRQFVVVADRPRLLDAFLGAGRNSLEVTKTAGIQVIGH